MTKTELLKAIAEKRTAAGGKSCWMSVDSEASLYVHITPLGQDRFYYRTKKIARRIGKVSDLSLGEAKAICYRPSLKALIYRASRRGMKIKKISSRNLRSFLIRLLGKESYRQKTRRQLKKKELS